MAAKRVASTRDISKKDVVDPKRKMEAQVWIETVLGRKINGDLFDDLQDGTVLCEVCNKIKPGTCTKFKRTKIAFVARSNIDIFVKGAKKLGVRETDLFETRDLYDKQRLSAVVQAIYAVSGVSRKHGFPGPFIGVAYSQANKRHFTKAQLAKSKSAIPMLNKGDKKTNVGSSHDSYGIVKDKKVSAQRISNVQSVWAQGAKRTDVSSKHDSYGIVKAKNLGKHSNVQSVWQQGSKKTDTASKHDSYGIVKTKQSKHSEVQSVWEKGSKKVDVSSKHDSYGIVKTKGNSKPSAVQGVWQQGSKRTDVSSKHDSYGIVKTKQNKHSNVQGVWQQGSKRTDVSSKHDSYGIVKTQGTSKHSNVQSVWEKGSKKVNSGKKQDSYGIIKTTD